MPPFTIAYRGVPSDDERDAAMRVVRQRGAAATWQSHPRYERTYALIEGCDTRDRVELRETTRAEVFENPLIALAVFPSAPELLSPLQHALGGPGRPDGVFGCEALSGGVLVEWNLERTSAEVILGLIDVELRRTRATRRTELLTPLPLAWWARIAACGLAAPEIGEDRVLEALLEKHGVVD